MNNYIEIQLTEEMIYDKWSNGEISYYDYPPISCIDMLGKPDIDDDTSITSNGKYYLNFNTKYRFPPKIIIPGNLEIRNLCISFQDVELIVYGDLSIVECDIYGGPPKRIIAKSSLYIDYTTINEADYMKNVSVSDKLNIKESKIGGYYPPSRGLYIKSIKEKILLNTSQYSHICIEDTNLNVIRLGNGYTELFTDFLELRRISHYTLPDFLNIKTGIVINECKDILFPDDIFTSDDMSTINIHISKSDTDLYRLYSSANTRKIRLEVGQHNDSTRLRLPPWDYDLIDIRGRGGIVQFDPNISYIREMLLRGIRVDILEYSHIRPISKKVNVNIKDIKCGGIITEVNY